VDHTAVPGLLAPRPGVPPRASGGPRPRPPLAYAPCPREAQEILAPLLEDPFEKEVRSSCEGGDDAEAVPPDDECEHSQIGSSIVEKLGSACRSKSASARAVDFLWGGAAASASSSSSACTDLQLQHRIASFDDGDDCEPVADDEDDHVVPPGPQGRCSASGSGGSLHRGNSDDYIEDIDGFGGFSGLAASAGISVLSGCPLGDADDDGPPAATPPRSSPSVNSEVFAYGPCQTTPRTSRGPGACDKLSREKPAPQKVKYRTLKYYPPPVGDTDRTPVDVIDHECEVLIIRREAVPAPPMPIFVASSTLCRG